MTLGRDASAAGTLHSLLMLLCVALPGLLGREERSLPRRGVRLPCAAGSSYREDHVIATCCFISPYSTCSVCVLVTQSCLTLCNPLDSSVHGILQARIILEWVAVSFSIFYPVEKA